MPSILQGPLLQGPLEFIRDYFSHASKTSSQDISTPEQIHSEAIDQDIDDLERKKTDVKMTPVRTLDGSYKDIPLEVLLRFVMIAKTQDYENLGRDRYKLIEEISKKIKAIDLATEKITAILNDTKALDLTKEAQLVQDLEHLGIKLPKNKKMTFEQASSFLTTIENKRDEHDRDMKMSHSKFQETMKDLESIRQALFHMQSYLREAIIKITGGMRGS